MVCISLEENTNYSCTYTSLNDNLLRKIIQFSAIAKRQCEENLYKILTQQTWIFLPESSIPLVSAFSLKKSMPLHRGNILAPCSSTLMNSQWRKHALPQAMAKAYAYGPGKQAGNWHLRTLSTLIIYHNRLSWDPPPTIPLNLFFLTMQRVDSFKAVSFQIGIKYLGGGGWVPLFDKYLWSYVFKSLESSIYW